MAKLPWLLQIAATIAVWVSLAISDTTHGSRPFVWCYNCGKGTTRLDAGIATNVFCNTWANTMMVNGQESGAGLQLIYKWSYYTTLTLTIMPQWYQTACPTDENDFTFNFDRCYYAFMAPIDACNTAGVSHKQGGFYMYYCAALTMNTDPEHCPGGYVAGTSSRVMAGFSSTTPTLNNTYHYYATDEEHEAAGAALLASGRLTSADLEEDCPDEQTTPAFDATSEVDEHISKDNDMIPTIEKRDTDTTCFDGSSGMECCGIDHTEA